MFTRLSLIGWDHGSAEASFKKNYSAAASVGENYSCDQTHKNVEVNGKERFLYTLFFFSLEIATFAYKPKLQKNSVWY